MKSVLVLIAVLHLPCLALGCPPAGPLAPPFDVTDGAVVDVDTPWTREASTDSTAGLVIEPTCASAAHELHVLGCPEGDDEQRFGVICTMGRGGAVDLRETCIAFSKTVDDVRRCCGPGEVCSHIKCQAPPR